MYRTIVLDPALREKFGELTDQAEVCDEQGKVVGMYLPLDTYKSFLRNIKIPFSEEEIARRKQEKGGCTLDEIWKKLGVK
jgi:hypothetical protein